jgi:hypothetical protein
METGCQAVSEKRKKEQYTIVLFIVITDVHICPVHWFTMIV